MILNVSDLLEKKNSKEAIFLGCGPSINDLSESAWKKIKEMDIWASNNWFIHDVVPNFYHLEVKLHRNGDFVKKMVKAKKDEYKDVNWILDLTRPYLFDTVKEGEYENIYVYEKTYREEAGFYTPSPDKVYVSCMASLTIVLDLMQKMNYEKIYFCGVDLYSSEYFWTGKEKYEKHGIPYLISTCKPDERPSTAPHTTFKTAKFIKEFGSHNKIDFVNLSKKSELRNYIPTENW
tara:strand:- start:9211 stop:9912 length:702 start_codon:yes stop_codon:yes gene_type:complete